MKTKNKRPLVLAFVVEDKLYIHPYLPDGYDSYEMFYWYRETKYNIDIIKKQSNAVDFNIKVDGVTNNDKVVPLVDDHQTHSVEVMVA